MRLVRFDDDRVGSKNINTTTPLLTLAELNGYYHDQAFEALCLKWADWLMNCLPRTREGGFQHVTSANGDRQGVRLNENEMWIDVYKRQELPYLLGTRRGRKAHQRAAHPSDEP